MGIVLIPVKEWWTSQDSRGQQNEALLSSADELGPPRHHIQGRGICQPCSGPQSAPPPQGVQRKNLLRRLQVLPSLILSLLRLRQEICRSRTKGWPQPPLWTWY